MFFTNEKLNQNLKFIEINYKIIPFNTHKIRVIHFIRLLCAYKLILIILLNRFMTKRE